VLEEQIGRQVLGVMRGADVSWAARSRHRARHIGM
jgi:hypothetical protein